MLLGLPKSGAHRRCKSVEGSFAAEEPNGCFQKLLGLERHSECWSSRSDVGSGNENHQCSRFPNNEHSRCTHGGVFPCPFQFLTFNMRGMGHTSGAGRLCSPQSSVVEPECTSQLAQHSSKNTITLQKWYLTNLSNDDDGRLVGIGGYLKSRSCVVRTGPIIDRVNKDKLRTCDGSEVYLCGSMDEETTLLNGFSAWVSRLFLSGFPSAWKQLLEDDRKSIGKNEHVDDCGQENSPVIRCHNPPLNVISQQQPEEDFLLDSPAGQPTNKVAEEQFFPETCEQGEFSSMITHHVKPAEQSYELEAVPDVSKRTEGKQGGGFSSMIPSSDRPAEQSYEPEAAPDVTKRKEGGKEDAVLDSLNNRQFNEKDVAHSLDQNPSIISPGNARSEEEIAHSSSTKASKEKTDQNVPNFGDKAIGKQKRKKGGGSEKKCNEKCKKSLQKDKSPTAYLSMKGAKTCSAEEHEPIVDAKTSERSQPLPHSPGQKSSIKECEKSRNARPEEKIADIACHTSSTMDANKEYNGETEPNPGDNYKRKQNRKKELGSTRRFNKNFSKDWQKDTAAKPCSAEKFLDAKNNEQSQLESDYGALAVRERQGRKSSASGKRTQIGESTKSPQGNVGMNKIDIEQNKALKITRSASRNRMGNEKSGKNQEGDLKANIEQAAHKRASCATKTHMRRSGRQNEKYNRHQAGTVGLEVTVLNVTNFGSKKRRDNGVPGKKPQEDVETNKNDIEQGIVCEQEITKTDRENEPSPAKKSRKARSNQKPEVIQIVPIDRQERCLERGSVEDDPFKFTDDTQPSVSVGQHLKESMSVKTLELEPVAASEADAERCVKRNRDKNFAKRKEEGEGTIIGSLTRARQKKKLGGKNNDQVHSLYLRKISANTEFSRTRRERKAKDKNKYGVCTRDDEAAQDTAAHKSKFRKKCQHQNVEDIGSDTHDGKNPLEIQARKSGFDQEIASIISGGMFERDENIGELSSSAFSSSAKKHRLRNSVVPPPLPSPRVSVQKTEVVEAFGLKTSRSGRIILPPLAYWRNQIAAHDMDGSLIAISDGFPEKAADTGYFNFKPPVQKRALEMQERLRAAASDIPVVKQRKKAR